MNNFSTIIKNTQFIHAPSYSLILATDERGGIGMCNDLPWKRVGYNSSADMAWFKEKTKGKIIVMGYNTWVSIGRKPLPGRVNIVVTKNNINELKDLINTRKVTDSVNEFWGMNTKLMAFESPQEVVSAIKYGITSADNGCEVMVIGGAQIYQAFMEWTSRIYLTTIEGEFEADTFVQLDLDKWDLIYRDNTQCLNPKFEIWDCTEEAAKRDDSDVMKINHTHLPARGWVKEAMSDHRLSVTENKKE